MRSVVRGAGRKSGCLMWRGRLGYALSLTLGLAVSAQSAQAETLADALASAYANNPTILAERKNLEATDEQVPQAKTNYRPRVTLRGDAGIEHAQTRTRGVFAGTASERDTPHGYQIEFSQSLFRGFRTANALRQAEANVLAARETLRDTEQQVLLQAVVAYMNVIRDQGIVRLRQNDVRVLSEDLRGTSIRFEAGDATRTDVAQARARRAGAVSALDLAKSNLRSSNAEYVRVIGHAPRNLRRPALPRRLLPKSVTALVATAEAETPRVVRAAFQELSARHAVDVIDGELLPSVDLQGSYSGRFNASTTVRQNDSASLVGRVTVPLYQGGGVYSRIRAAKRNRERAARQIDEARIAAKANAVTAWSQLQAARAQLKSVRVQVRSNQIALEGVRAEEKVGQRTLLDVLDAKQELLVSQSNLLTTQRDIIVAAYNVLATAGRLTAADVNLNVELHDPEVHYELVKPKFWGTTVTENEAYEGYVVQSGVLQ